MRRKRAEGGAQKRKSSRIPVERAQLGVRIEKRMLKVLKGLAEYHDVSLSALFEGIILHAFAGKDGRSCPSPFRPDSFRVIEDLKRVYRMDYDVHDNASFVEKGLGQRRGIR